MKQVHIHPEFNARSLAFDFAILITTNGLITSENQHFVLDYHIDTICLPKPEDETGFYETCYSTGWGKDNLDADGSYQSLLKEIEVSTLDKQNQNLDGNRMDLAQKVAPNAVQTKQPLNVGTVEQTFTLS